MAEAVDVTTTGTKGRKKRYLWLKIIGGIVGALVLFMGITFVVHTISNGAEKRKLNRTANMSMLMGKI